MKQIYADNACTSYPKPQNVIDAVTGYMTDIGANINRGSYSASFKTADRVFECRELIKDFFNASDARNVIFTRGITESLNVILMGLLKAGDSVITSSMEHNAVMRPLRQLERTGVIINQITLNKDMSYQVASDKHECITDALNALITDSTKAVVISHAGNVFGNVFPIEEIGAFCHKHNIYFIVDSAQSAGVIPIDMTHSHIDTLTFTGHKSLFGPQGIGGFVITDELAQIINPLIYGGTGSLSHTEYMPEFLPDKFEAGTLNIPGIIGLAEGIRFVNEISPDTIYKHENMLTERFIRGLEPLCLNNLITIPFYDASEKRRHTSCISVVFNTVDNAEAASILDEKYGIMTRVGLHCAPSAHKTMGTFPEGTVRFSFGYFNTVEEIDYIIEAVKRIVG